MSMVYLLLTLWLLCVQTAKCDTLKPFQCIIDNNSTKAKVMADAPTLLQVHSKHVMANALQLSLSTFPCQHYVKLEFELNLELVAHLYDQSNQMRNKNGHIQFYKSKNESPIMHKAKHRSYLGDAVVSYFNVIPNKNETMIQRSGYVSLNFIGRIPDSGAIDYSCQPFSAKIWVQDILYEIDHQPQSTLSQCPTMIVSISNKDIMDDFTTGAAATMFQPRKSKSSTSPEHHSRSLQQNIIPFENCFPNQYLHIHSVKIGLLIDDGFFNLFSNDIDSMMDFIETMFTHSNGVYEQQLNVHLKIGDVLVGNVPYFTFNEAPDPNIDQDCCTCTIQTNRQVQLDLLAQWNKLWWKRTKGNCTDAGFDKNSLDQCDLIDNNAVWVLLSKCDSLGIAYFGTLCDKDEFNSVIVNGQGADTWKAFAHEVAHSFGALDRVSAINSGLMNTVYGTYRGIYQFHINESEYMCNGIQSSMIGTDKVPVCWDVVDYGVVSYRWRQTGQYPKCSPCGDNSFSVEKIECIMDSDTDDVYVVNDVECNPALKPWAKFLKCEPAGDRLNDNEPTYCAASVCGNGFVEHDEQCDYLLDSECCDAATCTYNDASTTCSNKKRRIDAAFTDTSGKLYIFQGAQFAVYENIDSKYPLSGYPKLISEAFPMTSYEMSSDIDAAFCTSDNTAYIFKDFKYIKVDLSVGIGTGHGIDSQTLASATKIKRWSNFGYINDMFFQCGKVNAAYSYNDGKSAVLVCDSMYYIFDVGKTILNKNFSMTDFTEETVRPFWADFDITFSDHLMKNQYTIDAAVYDYKSKKVRFYLGDQYVDYANKQQISSATKITPMGYWTLNVPDSTQCTVTNCKYCDVNDVSICDECESDDYMLHNNYCYTSDYIAVITFDNSALGYDEQYIRTDASGLQYTNAASAKLGTSCLQFDSDTIVQLYSPTMKRNGDMKNLISLTNWQVSLYLYPTQVSGGEARTFLTLVNKDESRLVFQVTPNTVCSSFSLNVYYQNRTAKSLSIASDNIVIYDGYSDDCSSNIYGLYPNYWNKLTLQVTDLHLSITSNDLALPSAAKSDLYNANILSIDLADWWLGGGYIGNIDQLIVQTSDDWIYIPDSTTDAENPVTAGSQCVPAIPWTQVVSYGTLGLVMYSLMLFGVFRKYTINNRDHSGLPNLQSGQQTMEALQEYADQLQALQTQHEIQKNELEAQKEKLNEYEELMEEIKQAKQQLMEQQQQQQEQEMEYETPRPASQHKPKKRKSTARHRESVCKLRRSSTVELEYVPGEEWRQKRKSSVFMTPPGMTDDEHNISNRRRSSGLTSHAKALNVLRNARQQYFNAIGHESNDNDDPEKLEYGNEQAKGSPLGKAATNLWRES